MKGQMVAVDQAANIGIQFQGERPSGPAFIIWSIPTKRTPVDAAGKAGDADFFTTVPSDRPGGIGMGKQILIRCSVKVDVAACLRAIAVFVYLT
jgi:hypothetical protein